MRFVANQDSPLSEAERLRGGYVEMANAHDAEEGLFLQDAYGVALRLRRPLEFVRFQAHGFWKQTGQKPKDRSISKWALRFIMQATTAHELKLADNFAVILDGLMQDLVEDSAVAVRIKELGGVWAAYEAMRMRANSIPRHEKDQNTTQMKPSATGKGLPKTKSARAGPSMIKSVARKDFGYLAHHVARGEPEPLVATIPPLILGAKRIRRILPDVFDQANFEGALLRGGIDVIWNSALNPWILSARVLAVDVPPDAWGRLRGLLRLAKARYPELLRLKWPRSLVKVQPLDDPEKQIPSLVKFPTLFWPRSSPGAAPAEPPPEEDPASLADWASDYTFKDFTFQFGEDMTRKARKSSVWPW